MLGRYDTLGSNGDMVEKPECCYDVPLLDSLQSLLKCPSVIEQVRTSKNTIKGGLSNLTYIGIQLT